MAEAAAPPPQPEVKVAWVAAVLEEAVFRDNLKRIRVFPEMHLLAVEAVEDMHRAARSAALAVRA